MSKDRLIEIVKKFEGKAVLVAGDLMLDEYWYGDMAPFSPEPQSIKVVGVKKEYKLGGAANAAANISSLGGNCFLFGVIGEDFQSRSFLLELRKLNNGINRGHIYSNEIVKDGTRITTTKVRSFVFNPEKGFISSDYRWDWENTFEINRFLEMNVLKGLSYEVPRSDIVLVSDYNKGFLTRRIIEKIREVTEESDKEVILDPKPVIENPERNSLFKGFTWLKPNMVEASRLSTKLPSPSLEKLSYVRALAGNLVDTYSPQNLLITSGKEGMYLFEKKTEVFHNVPAIKKDNLEIIGAGDTVSAVLALSLATGATPLEATVISNYAASVVVEKPGTAALTKVELIEAIRNY